MVGHVRTQFDAKLSYQLPVFVSVRTTMHWPVNNFWQTFEYVINKKILNWLCSSSLEYGKRILSALLKTIDGNCTVLAVVATVVHTIRIRIHKRTRIETARNRKLRQNFFYLTSIVNFPKTPNTCSAAKLNEHFNQQDIENQILKKNFHSLIATITSKTEDRGFVWVVLGYRQWHEKRAWVHSS